MTREDANIEIIKKVYNGLYPAAEPWLRMVKIVGDILLIPLDKLHALAERKELLCTKFAAAAKSKYPDYFEKNFGNVMQAMSDMPLDVDEVLVNEWEALISESPSPNYRRYYSQILSALTGDDLKLLEACALISSDGRITHNALLPHLTHPFVDEKREINRVVLSLSFASLERQSLIATKNNLNILYWNLRNEKDPDFLEPNPKGHQVTALGFEFLRVCGRKTGQPDAPAGSP